MIKVNRDKSGRIFRRNRDLNQQQYSTSTAGLDGLDVGVSVMTGPSFEVNLKTQFHFYVFKSF